MFKDIYKQIKKYDTIVIARHIGADPDALASQMALRDSIKNTFPNKKVSAIGLSSTRFNYFPRLDRQESQENSLLIVVDTPDKKRIDINSFDGFDYKIKIDHHPWVEDYADLEYIDDSSSSCCEIIIDLIKNTKLEMNKEIAEMLFMGLISDTNRFLYSTNTVSMRKAADLIDEYKLDTNKLYFNIYKRPLSEIRLLGYIEQNMTVTENGLAYINITNKIMNEFGVDVGSAGNLVNNLNSINEVLVWLAISEDVKNELLKINIRSRGPIINTVAEKYNGGGHKFASGARIYNKDDVKKLIKDLDEACRDYLSKGDNYED